MILKLKVTTKITYKNAYNCSYQNLIKQNAKNYQKTMILIGKPFLVVKMVQQC